MFASLRRQGFSRQGPYEIGYADGKLVIGVCNLVILIKTLIYRYHLSIGRVDISVDLDELQQDT